MKTGIKKTALAVGIASVMAGSAVCGGVLLAQNGSGFSTDNSSLAAGRSGNSSVEVTTSDTSIVAGKIFEVSVTINARPTSNRLWYSISTRLVPLISDGSAIDNDLYQYLRLPTQAEDTEGKYTFSRGKYQYKVPDETAANFDAANYLVSFKDMLADNDAVVLGLTWKGSSTDLDCFTETNVPYVYTFPLVVDDSIVTDHPEITSMVLGFAPLGSNVISTVDRTGTDQDVQADKASDGTLAVTNLNISLRSANDEANVDDIVVDPGEDEEGNPLPPITVDPNDPASSVLMLPDKPEKIVHVQDINFPADSTGATVKVGTTDVAGNAPAEADLTPSGSSDINIPVTDDKHVVYLQVTPENGNTANIKEYYVTVYFSYARLNELSVKSDSAAIGTDRELIENYTVDTLAYTVKYPSDATKAVIGATLVEGYNTATDIVATGAGCAAPATLTNGGSIEVTEITDGATVTLKLLSMAYGVAGIDDNSQAYKEYVITFEAVSTEAEISLAVKSVADATKSYENDAAKATENGVDGYYTITESPAQATVEVIATSAGSAADYTIVKIGEDGSETEVYDSKNPPATPVNYGEGTYVVKAVAEAGNTVEYKFILAKLGVLKLIDGSSYQFMIIEKNKINDDDVQKFRRTYAELNWQHGVDDIDVTRFYKVGWDETEDAATVSTAEFNRIVLGQIVATKDEAKTTVTEVLAQIEPAQHEMLHFYNADGELVYENGNYTSAVTIEDDKQVATGWRVEFGAGDDADVVYLSVLGDVDGDSYVNTGDSSLVNGYFVNPSSMAMFANAEVLMAAMIMNDGYIDTGDSSIINSIFIGAASTSDYFYPGSSAQ
jgi:hypothetical protein